MGLHKTVQVLFCRNSFFSYPAPNPDPYVCPVLTFGKDPCITTRDIVFSEIHLKGFRVDIDIPYLVLDGNRGLLCFLFEGKTF